MSKATGDSSRSFARSSVFSLILLISLLLLYGTGAHLVILAPPVLFLANIFFLRWSDGGISKAVPRIVAKSIGFMAVFFLLSIAWVKFFPSGQIGYGERLQISEGNITILGYGLLLKWSISFGSLVFASAVFASLFMRGNNDNSV